MAADVHTWAAAAVRATLRRCVLSLAAGLDREARRYGANKATRMEAAEQAETARQLRDEARRAGLL